MRNMHNGGIFMGDYQFYKPKFLTPSSFESCRLIVY